MLRFSTMAALFLFLIIPSSQGWMATRSPQKVLRMEATAYSQAPHLTAAGTIPHEGTAAADPAVLPLGSRIRVLDAGAWSRTYVITDTGSRVQGRHIDIFVPSEAEAKRFGKKMVLVQVLEIGAGRKNARDKDPAAIAGR